MDVREAIETRRAYRSLDPVEITEELVRDLADCARLAPSCFNKQPWNYVFVYDDEVLLEMHNALSEGNEWCTLSSMIIAVFGKKEDDCVIHDRAYYLFDIGMATAHIILRATELGLVAHPIAGYSPSKVREILSIPEEMNVITLVNVGKHADEIYPILTDKQREAEPERPERKELGEFVYVDEYGNKVEEK